MRWLVSAFGFALFVVGSIGTYNFFVEPQALVDGAWAALDGLRLLSPAIAGSGLLVLWAALWLTAEVAAKRLRILGIRMGVAGLALILIPPIVGYSVDVLTHAEGRFTALSAAILCAEPGACLLVAALVLLFRSANAPRRPRPPAAM